MFARSITVPVQVRAAILCGLIATIAISNKAAAQPFKHQVTGLFSLERLQDLRDAVAKMEQVKLVSIDFANAEAVFDYDAKAVFPKVKPEQIPEKLDALLKTASNHTFGIKPLRTLPREKLKYVEIPVAGLDCKACCLAAYESIYKLDGVEQATASFRDRLVTAWIDPLRTDRARLEEALKKKGVILKTSN